MPTCRPRRIRLLLAAPLLAAPSVLAQPCGLGTFSATGQAPCMPCPAGTYQPGTGATTCLQCIAGSFNPFTGRAACEPCPAGTIADHYGATSCAPCPAGTYNPYTDQIVCLNCTPGTYQPGESAISCLPCPAGSFGTDLRMSSCNPCPLGTFAGLLGSTQCSNCPASTFAPTTGSISCLVCPTGLTSPSPRPVYCLPCPAGYYFAVGTGCVPCPPGADCSIGGTIVGNGCPPGFWRQETNGQAICQPCSLGMPTIALQPPATVDAAIGDTVQIGVSMISFPGTPALSYYWRHDGLTISASPTIMGQDSAVIHIGPIALTDAGDYDVVISNSCGWVTSTPAHLRVFCPADYNRSGIVSVQDIFDFLAGYFGHDPQADFNHSGAIGVQDIFDFLAAYFTPCP